MRNGKILSGLLLFLCFNMVDAQTKPFEGEIKYKITTNNTEEDGVIVKNYAYFFSGNKIRIEKLDDKDKSFTIIDTGKAAYYYKNYDKVKTYMELTKEQFDNDYTAKEEQNAAALKLKNGLTDEKKEILGYKCRKIYYKVAKIFADGFYNCELWVLCDKSTLMTVANFDISTASIDECLENGIIPMLIITTLDNGKEVERYEAVKIEEKKLKQNIFNSPKDYKKYVNPLPSEDEYEDEEEY